MPREEDTFRTRFQNKSQNSLAAGPSLDTTFKNCTEINVMSSDSIFESRIGRKWRYWIHFLDRYQYESHSIKQLFIEMNQVYKSLKQTRVKLWKNYPVKAKTEQEIICRYRMKGKHQYMLCPFDLHSWKEIEKIERWEKCQSIQTHRANKSLQMYEKRIKQEMRHFNLKISKK